MNILENFLNLNEIGPQINIGVVGDAMIDMYFDTKVKKISPEFPIPVYQSDNESSYNLPGGSANTVYQFKNFKVKADLIAFIDQESEICFKNHGINVENCIKIDQWRRNINCKIPRKKRFYSDDFPAFRWDVEQNHYGLGRDLNKKCEELYNKIRKNVKSFQALIFSDYNKGVLEEYNHLLIQEVPISVVDPKAGNIDRWRGCTVFKPNKSEALVLSGQSNIADAAKYFHDRLQCKAVVITEAERGITVYDGELYEIRPDKALSAAQSVIGAGDCFTAFLAMALSREMSIREAAEVAWNAGTLYVKNKHNKPLIPRDLKDPIFSKFVKPQDLINRDFKLAATGGCFDLFHCGHLESLKFAKSKGDKLVVLINSDESIKKLKGDNRPIIPLDQRMNIVASIEYVDYVISFEQDSPREILDVIKPDVFVKGSSYLVDQIKASDGVDSVFLCPIVDGISTTKIIEKLKSI